MGTQEITITLSQVMSSIEAVNALISVPMPAATAFNVRKVATLIEGERKTVVETIDSRRTEFLGDKEELSPEDIDILNKEIEALLDSNIELKANKINITDLGTANVKPVTLMALDWLVVG